MIDVYSMVFDTIYTGLQTGHSDANISSGYIEESAKFPAVVVEEIGNEPYMRMATDNNCENYALLTYEVSVYSDKKDTARSECAALIAAVDDIMQNTMKFQRIRKNRPINISRTIYRQYARYEVVVREGQTIGQNTVYQMYRR